MGNLIVNQIDLNDPSVVQNLLGSLTNLTTDRRLYHDLVFKLQHYFETPNSKPPSSSGWYIILEGKCPLYVGTAKDLNKRLNTNKGSTDNFGWRGRTSDPVRNFVKKFNQIHTIAKLRVFVIPESELFLGQLNDLDRRNIEKLISVFRCRLRYPSQNRRVLMTGQTFEVSLWFNSGKSAKQRQLTNSTKNSGVGINIPEAGRKYFSKKSKTVELHFDDGTHGTATVDKCSWGSCTHLIDTCIGAWARNNGLWSQKLKKASVRFSMKVIKDFTVYKVFIK
jgi:hypothetical protein